MKKKCSQVYKNRPHTSVAVMADNIMEKKSSKLSMMRYHNPLNCVALPKVQDFLRTSGGGGRGLRLDFPAFVKAFAWIFYRTEGSGSSYSTSDDSNDRNSDASLSSESSRDRKSRHRLRRKEGQKSNKLGYGSGGRRSPEKDHRGRRQRHSDTIGIGEEAELRRWVKRLGDSQMGRLHRIFDDMTEGSGGMFQARDLGKCFSDIGKDIEPRKLRAWCDEVDLAPGDALSLADVAYAFHAMFVGTRGQEEGNHGIETVRSYSIAWTW